jgi:hypothetical protein
MNVDVREGERAERKRDARAGRCEFAKPPSLRRRPSDVGGGDDAGQHGYAEKDEHERQDQLFGHTST